MVDLPRAARELVEAARTQAQPRALKAAVESLLGAFAKASAGARSSAIRSIGRALPEVDGRGAQILCLALGALVEGGASPELVSPIVLDDLQTLIEDATAFASAAVKKAKNRHVDAAIEAVGPAIARKMPEEASAWNALPSRCLTAVACLTRSKKVRAAMRDDFALQEAAWPLSDAVAGVGDLLQALRIVDGETFLVLAPETKQGWRVAVDAVASNAELYILLADALVGDPKKGRVAGKRPDRRAVTALRGAKNAPAAAASVVVPFHLVEPHATAHAHHHGPHDDHDHDHDHDHLVPMEGLPGDISVWNRTRVLLLEGTPYPQAIPVVPSFEALRPDVRIVAELSSPEVVRMLAKLGVPTVTPAAPTAAKKRSAKKKASAKRPARR